MDLTPPEAGPWIWLVAGVAGACSTAFSIHGIEGRLNRAVDLLGGQPYGFGQVFEMYWELWIMLFVIAAFGAEMAIRRLISKSIEKL